MTAPIHRVYCVEGRRLESIEISEARPAVPIDPPPAACAPAIVMLHEGLGSVAHWKQFPMELAARTRARVFVYSRHGHGGSDRLDAPRSVHYMHHEAEIVLPEILRQAGIERPVLVGHSDGASIAILYAGMYSQGPRAIVLEAPHVFVEDETVRGIAQSKILYDTTDLPDKLARYHAHADALFRAWSDIWLAPEFRKWNIEEYLPKIRCPVLTIQGAEDEYGTIRQLDAIRARVPSAESIILENCKHAPHRDQPRITLELIARFVHESGPSRR